MTPEERAYALLQAMSYVPTLIVAPETFSALHRAIAAAIREAVTEEREACANLAESKRATWQHEADGESLLAYQRLYGMAEGAQNVAAAIRARG
jgi:hypothetical protein